MRRAIVAFKIPRRNNDRSNYARSVAAGDRSTYEWQYAKAGEAWIDLEPTRQSQKVLAGLVAGSTYQFRVRSVTRTGRSDFGEVVSFLVV